MVGKGKYEFLKKMPKFNLDVIEYNKKNTERFSKTLDLFDNAT